MGNGIAAGIRIHPSVPAACPDQRVCENPLLWTFGPHWKNPFGSGALFAWRFKDLVSCHASAPKRSCLSLLRIITSMGKIVGRNHTCTTSEKKMCLIIDLSFRLFSSTAVTWKPAHHAGKGLKIAMKSASRALTKQDVKKQLRETSVTSGLKTSQNHRFKTSHA
jgi:hypothetical protein